MNDLHLASRPVDRDTAAGGERERAFARMVDERLVGQYRIAAVILGDPVEAQDAVHDAFERAWHAWPDLQDPDRFDAWVGRIVVNCCRDRLRRRSRRKVTDISADVQERMAAPDELGSAIDRDEIRRAFSALNTDQQIAVVLRFYADLTVDQIAERVGAPAGTVKSRLHHALAALNAEMGRSRSGGAS